MAPKQGDLIVTIKDEHHGPRLGAIKTIDEPGGVFGTIYWVDFVDGTSDQLLHDQFTTEVEGFIYRIKGDER